MDKILDLSITDDDLGSCSAGDIVEFIGPSTTAVNDGALFVVQGFVGGWATIARIDRYTLCFVDGIRAIDGILNSLRFDYDVAPTAFGNFRRVDWTRI